MTCAELEVVAGIKVPLGGGHARLDGARQGDGASSSVDQDIWLDNSSRFGVRDQACRYLMEEAATKTGLFPAGSGQL